MQAITTTIRRRITEFLLVALGIEVCAVPCREPGERRKDDDTDDVGGQLVIHPDYLKMFLGLCMGITPRP
jgi:hypothetical protein